MALRKEQHEQGWLGEGIRHLELLCQQAIESADEGDVCPTKKGQASAVKLMRTLSHAHVPTMALTVNGEIALTWEYAGDAFRAYVDQSGAVRFYRNKAALDQRTFTKYLTAIPA